MRDVRSVEGAIGSVGEDERREERAARCSALNPAEEDRRCERCVSNKAAELGGEVCRVCCVGIAIAAENCHQSAGGLY